MSRYVVKNMTAAKLMKIRPSASFRRAHKLKASRRLRAAS